MRVTEYDCPECGIASYYQEFGDFLAVSAIAVSVAQVGALYLVGFTPILALTGVVAPAVLGIILLSPNIEVYKIRKPAPRRWLEDEQ